MRALTLLFALAALPALAQEADCTDIGTLTAEVNGNPPRDWVTRDCSLGARDLSAFVSVASNTSFVGVTGWLPGLDTNEGRLALFARMPALWQPATGPLENVEIVLLMEDDFDGPRYVSGTDARVVLERVDWPREVGDWETRMEGNFSATLCLAPDSETPADPGTCLPISGSFDSLAAISLPYAWFRDGVWPTP